MKALVEIEIDNKIKDEYDFGDFKGETDLVIHSNKRGSNVARITKVYITEGELTDVAYAMRRGLGDNPCVIIDTHHPDPLKRYDHYHFSDPDLVSAFMIAKLKD